MLLYVYNLDMPKELIVSREKEIQMLQELMSYRYID